MSHDKGNEMYTLYATTCFPWEMRAYTHYRAAELIYTKAERAAEIAFTQPTGSLANPAEVFQDVLLWMDYLLLMGYALENLSKGYLLWTEPGKYLEDGGNLAKAITNHELPDLLCKCGVVQTDDEREVLEQVVDVVKWEKYPVPRKASEFVYDPRWKAVSASLRLTLHRLCNKVSDLISKERVRRETPGPALFPRLEE